MDILFEFILAGRCSSKVKITGLRYFHEVDPEPREGWMIHIYGLNQHSMLELDTISVYLMEKGYDVNNIEVFMEHEQ
jgi:hypothetical protein